MGVPNPNPIFAHTPNAAEDTFVNADGTTSKLFITGGAFGTKVIMGAVHSTDPTIAHVLDVIIDDGTTEYTVGSVAVPTDAGTDGGTTPAVSLLDAVALPWLDADGEFVLPPDYELRVAPQVAVTAAETLTIVIVGMDY